MKISSEIRSEFRFILISLYIGGHINV